MLRQTQATLAACAAENAHLKDENMRVHEQLRTLERRYEEMHLSNHSLVNGMKRHDDTLRHIHERSREEGMALQQMTIKYHRACDEIAELKKTVVALEEKVGGVHVAADKATIALLARDLQKMHAKLTTAMAQQNASPESERWSISSGQVLHRLLLSVLEQNGAASTELQLLEMLNAQSLGSDASLPTQVPLTRMFSGISVSPSKMQPERTLLRFLMGIPATDLAFGIERVATALTKQIALFHQTTNQLTFRESSSSPSFATAGSLVLTPLVSATDLIQTRGTDDDVPEYLRYTGVVRNLYYDRRRVELLIAKVRAYKDDLEGKANRQNGHPSSVGGSGHHRDV
jgi:hypothetical protein